MTDTPAPDQGPGAVFSDPRIEADQLRVFDGPDRQPLVVVGCVHDHPASEYRVRTLVESLVPDVVAVELPGLAVPLFERAGRADGSERSLGGEMSAALAAGAAVDARRVGIDTIDLCFLRSLVGELRRESVSIPTLRRVLGAVSNVATHALSCRVSSALGRFGSLSPVEKRSYGHEIDRTTPPVEQAADEQRQLDRGLAVLRALERPVADTVVDTVRERTMAAQISSLVMEESVLAVVGFDHLSGIADLLEDRCGSRRDPDAETMAELWG